MRTVVLAYAIIWVVIFAYLVAQANRLAALQRELESLKKLLKPDNSEAS